MVSKIGWMARSGVSVGAVLQRTSRAIALPILLAFVACGQKGALIAVKPAAAPSSAAARAPLPPPEPLEAPVPGTAPR